MILCKCILKNNLDEMLCFIFIFPNIKQCILTELLTQKVLCILWRMLSIFHTHSTPLELFIVILRANASRQICYCKINSQSQKSLPLCVQNQKNFIPNSYCLPTPPTPVVSYHPTQPTTKEHVAGCAISPTPQVSKSPTVSHLYIVHHYSPSLYVTHPNISPA